MFLMLEEQDAPESEDDLLSVPKGKSKSRTMSWKPQKIIFNLAVDVSYSTLSFNVLPYNVVQEDDSVPDLSSLPVPKVRIQAIC